MPRLTFYFLLLTLALSACAAPAVMPTPTPLPPPTATLAPTVTPTLAPTATPAPPFRVVGYATDATVVGVIPFDKLTHINYAFLIPNADGTFARFANGWKLDDLVNQAHTHNVQVLISVGGWGWDAQFEATAADPAYRAAFVANLTAFVAEHHLDGADIDWEYPDPGASSENFLALLRELRAALPAGKLLTAAVVALGATGEGIPAESFPLMDFVNLMAYDGDGPQHASLQFAQDSIAYWQGRGLPPAQTVLGVPFYSHPNFVAYKKLVDADPAAAQQDEIKYYSTLVNYNGIPTLQAKTRLALQTASGLMIWTLEYDTLDETSLLSAIDQVVHR